MKKIRQKQFYFSPFEAALWEGSVLLILAAFMAFDRTNCLSLAASLVGGRLPPFQRQGPPARPAADGRFQSALRHRILYLCLLRGNAHLSRHDRPHVRIFPDLLAAASLPGRCGRGTGPHGQPQNPSGHCGCRRMLPITWGQSTPTGTAPHRCRRCRGRPYAAEIAAAGPPGHWP